MGEGSLDYCGTAPRVAIVIVGYHSWQDLQRCLPSVQIAVQRAMDAGVVSGVEVVVVDNASNDETMDEVVDETAEKLLKVFTDVQFVRSETNLGFAGGNNLGWERVEAGSDGGGCDYLVLLNPDTVVHGDWLLALVEAMVDRPGVVAAQSKLRLLTDDVDDDAEPARINSAGNVSHVSGLGFVSELDQLDSHEADAFVNQARPIAFASGAAMLIRASWVRQHGLFDPATFMYVEDEELGWRIRLTGGEICYVPSSVAYHRYEPLASLNHLEAMQRNRLRLLLTVYRWQTLLVFLPTLILIELAVLFSSILRGQLGGWFRGGLGVMGSLADGSLMQRRRAIQRTRQVGDRDLLGLHEDTIQFEPLLNPLVRYGLNPLMGLWGTLVRWLVWW